MELGKKVANFIGNGAKILPLMKGRKTPEYFPEVESYRFAVWLR